MHLRITLLCLVFCGRRRGNGRCINNGAAMHDKTSVVQPLIHISKNLFAVFVLLEKMAELQQSG